MLEHAFIQRAALAGIALALVVGPVGCLVVWNRMAYFGTALAHNAFLGVALGLVLGIAPTAGIVVSAVAVALLLTGLERQRRLPRDTLLGLLAHAGMALGLVALAFLEGMRVDLMGYLFGDVLAVSWTDVGVISAAAVAMLALLRWLWHPLVLVSVNAELAAADGLSVARLRLALNLMLAVTVALAMKIVGVLLITSLLIIPAAAARSLAATPERMAVLAVAGGLLATLGGLAASFHLDLPSGPAMVVVAAILFALSLPLRPRGG